jgi:hypothetical protein
MESNAKIFSGRGSRYLAEKIANKERAEQEKAAAKTIDEEITMKKKELSRRMAEVRKAEEKVKEKERLARLEPKIKAREDKVQQSSSSSSPAPDAGAAAPDAGAPAGDAAPAPDAGAPDAGASAFLGGYKIESLLKIDKELEKIRSNKKKINKLLYNKVGGNVPISDNSNFIPHNNNYNNNKIITVDTSSDSPTSMENSNLPISDYKQHLNETLAKLKNEVPLNNNLKHLLSKFDI